MLWPIVISSAIAYARPANPIMQSPIMLFGGIDAENRFFGIHEVVIMVSCRVTVNKKTGGESCTLMPYVQVNESGGIVESRRRKGFAQCFQYLSLL